METLLVILAVANFFATNLVVFLLWTISSDD